MTRYCCTDSVDRTARGPWSRKRRVLGEDSPTTDGLGQRQPRADHVHACRPVVVIQRIGCRATNMPWFMVLVDAKVLRCACVGSSVMVRSEGLQPRLWRPKIASGEHSGRLKELRYCSTRISIVVSWMCGGRPTVSAVGAVLFGQTAGQARVIAACQSQPGCATGVGRDDGWL